MFQDSLIGAKEFQQTFCPRAHSAAAMASFKRSSAMSSFKRSREAREASLPPAAVAPSGDEADASSTTTTPKGQRRRKPVFVSEEADVDDTLPGEASFTRRWRSSLRRSSASMPEAVRVDALKAIVGLCNDLQLKVDLWHDEETRKLLLDCAAPGQPDAVRRLALAAVASLAVAALNKHGIWQEARSVIVAAGAENESESVRRQGLWCLVNVCSTDTMPGVAATGDNVVPSGGGEAWWDDAADGARAIMRRSAGAHQPGDLRMLALLALTNLADRPSHRRSMWDDDATRAALLGCADRWEPELLRMQAMRTVLGLAHDDDNKGSLRRKWASLDAEGARLREMLAGPVADARSRVNEPAKHILARLEIPPEEVQREIAALVKEVARPASRPMPSMSAVIDAVRAADTLGERMRGRRLSLDETSNSPSGLRAANEMGAAKASAVASHRRNSFDGISSRGSTGDKGASLEAASTTVDDHGSPAKADAKRKTVVWVGAGEWRSDDDATARTFRLDDSQRGRSIIRRGSHDAGVGAAYLADQPPRPARSRGDRRPPRVRPQLTAAFWRAKLLRTSRSHKVVPEITVSESGVKCVPLSLLTPELYMEETGEDQPFRIRNITDKLRADDEVEASFKTQGKPDDDVGSNSVNMSTGDRED